ncbi:hypothetical protein [Pseudarthrobacter sp. H2]|uniref:hypothetical protein n=1 Tax=Pseudarthrobacter sp. H2 TaxID=3418415 RepID=UPI003CF14053
MHSVEAKAPINARSSTVWDIITDAGNFTVGPDARHGLRGLREKRLLQGVVRDRSVRSGPERVCNV